MTRADRCHWSLFTVGLSCWLLAMTSVTRAKNDACLVHSCENISSEAHDRFRDHCSLPGMRTRYYPVQLFEYFCTSHSTQSCNFTGIKKSAIPRLDSSFMHIPKHSKRDTGIETSALRNITSFVSKRHEKPVVLYARQFTNILQKGLAILSFGYTLSKWSSLQPNQICWFMNHDSIFLSRLHGLFPTLFARVRFPWFLRYQRLTFY